MELFGVLQVKNQAERIRSLLADREQYDRDEEIIPVLDDSLDGI